MKILHINWDLSVYISVDPVSYFIQVHSTLIQELFSAEKPLSVKYGAL